MSVTIVGVDPGLVHTGAVRVSFDQENRSIARECEVFEGLAVEFVAEWVNTTENRLVVVEKYRPRLKLGPDPMMLSAEQALKQLVPKAVLLENMGVRKIVPPGLMQALGLWDFPIRTHHQDLRSAARIMLKGMVREHDLNSLIADVVVAHLSGKDWEIRDWDA